MENSKINLVPRSLIGALLFGLLVSVAAFSDAAVANPDAWKNEGWNKTDFSKRSIKWNEIRSGGVPKDGIPSIDKPKFMAAADDKELTPRDPVIGIEINGDARAYPLRVLIWHEIANDTVGNIPLAITFCPLCNSAIVFDRRVNGKVLDFGTTGKLRNSDLVMYDRQSQSWWQQFTGEAIVGAMLGTQLKMLPARLESFAEFKARYPKGKVLVPNNPRRRSYGENPYRYYDSAQFPFLYNGDMPKGIEPMARVVVIKAKGTGRSGKARAVALSAIRKTGSYKLGDIELKWTKGQASALDHGTIAKGRDVGSVIASRKSADGTVLDVPYDVTFAFVFHAFHPNQPIAMK